MKQYIKPDLEEILLDEEALCVVKKSGGDDLPWIEHDPTNEYN